MQLAVAENHNVAKAEEEARKALVQVHDEAEKRQEAARKALEAKKAPITIAGQDQIM